MFPDRVITIKGSIDNMSAAEAAITAKLRECHEKEMLPLVSGPVFLSEWQIQKEKRR